LEPCIVTIKTAVKGSNDPIDIHLLPIPHQIDAA